MKKKTIIILASIVLLGIICAVFIFTIFQYNTGVVTKITAKASDGEHLELALAYFLPMGGYSVREVAEDEGEYCGDGIKDYDGSLGKYRIMIEFGDIEPHESLSKRANENGIFEIKNSAVTLNAKIVHPSDHGFVLYIGADVPIYVERSNASNLSGLFGGIKIPIVVGEKNK